jgi:hypothetical protein
MSLLSTVSNLWLKLEHGHLVFLALLNHISDDLGSIYGWPAQSDLIPISDKVNPIELNTIPLDCKLVHCDSLPRGDLILLASGFHYSVNRRPPNLSYLEILPTPTCPVKLMYSEGPKRSPKAFYSVSVLNTSPSGLRSTLTLSPS